MPFKKISLAFATVMGLSAQGTLAACHDDAMTFTADSLHSFTAQDVNGNYAVVDDCTVYVADNTWVETDQMVTIPSRTTQLVFGYQSSGSEGEVHGIALNRNEPGQQINPFLFYKLHGTQGPIPQFEPNLEHNDYTSGEGYREYRIYVGHLVGKSFRIVLSTDQDVNAGASALFQNIRIVDYGNPTNPVVTPEPTPEPTPPPTTATPQKPDVPQDNQRYFLLGQDVTSIQGYMNQADLPRPAGFTMYVTLARGEPSYDGSYCFKGLDGLKNTDNYNSNNAEGCSDNGRRQNHWGSDEQNVEWAINTYNPEIISIGLWCPQNQRLPSLYQNGAYDDLLTELADFFKQHSSTRFFLRTCYEFNGDAGGWSDANFRETFKHVRTFLDGQGVQNVAHVWQSDSFHGTGRGTNAIGDQEQGYWPGKRYVDWVGSSQFDSDVGEEAQIAEAEGLPHFIAEATPHGALHTQYDFKLPFGGTGSSPNGQKTLLSDTNWFDRKRGEITRSSTKAWHYINADWSVQPQWANAPDQAGADFFKFTDSRIEVNEQVKAYFNSFVTPENGFILGE